MDKVKDLLVIYKQSLSPICVSPLADRHLKVVRLGLLRKKIINNGFVIILQGVLCQTLHVILGYHLV